MALCLALAACSPALNWREVRVPEGAGMVALFPCKPEHQQRTVALAGVEGGPLALHLLSCQADGATWALSYADAGTAQRRLAALPALRQALWGNLHTTQAPQGALAPIPPLGADLPPLAPLTVAGATVHPASGHSLMRGQRPLSATQSEPVAVHAWFFSKGLHVFQASMVHTALQQDDPRAQAFAAGFNFPR